MNFKKYIQEDFTPVCNPEDLNGIRNNLSGKYILMNDIDLSEYESWIPVGTLENPFCGVFNGNSFTVKNLKISMSENEIPSVGLFGTVMNAQIENLTVSGKINVHNCSEVRMGLICAEAYNSIISNCRTYGSVTASAEAGVWVGGMAGYLSSEYELGEMDCLISRCSNNADVSVNGICNHTFYAVGCFAGGIVGASDGTIIECSNYGDVSVICKRGDCDYSSAIAGGICGNSAGEINNSRNLGSISSSCNKFACAAGISGYWFQFGHIRECYSLGKIEALPSDSPTNRFRSAVGAITGETEDWLVPDCSDNRECQGGIFNCRFSDCTEKAFGNGFPQNVENVKALTVGEFADRDAFSGFDFENIWSMDNENGYPVLKESVNSENPPEDNPVDNKPAIYLTNAQNSKGRLN